MGVRNVQYYQTFNKTAKKDFKPLSIPKITFGMIVLNGEPFIRYNLRAIYPFAHQIIVVEGAAPSAKSVATAGGHSRDGTLETLSRFKAEEDFENKLIIVTAEDEGHSNGCWPGEKDEMSQAYAKRATGNYLWQIDHDEFYKFDDMNAIITLLRNQPDITSITFRTLNFWGGIRYRVDSLWLRCGDQDFHRVFAWGSGFHYKTHRPPTVVDAQGRNQREIKPLTAAQMARKGIYLYHYEYLFPFQVKNKAIYYSYRDRVPRHPLDWFDNNYMKLSNPFKVHNLKRWLSWLEPYSGRHPEKITEMMGDLHTMINCNIVFRHTEDIDNLLKNIFYHLTKSILKLLSVPTRLIYTDLRFCLKKFAISWNLWPLIQQLRGRDIDGNLL